MTVQDDADVSAVPQKDTSPVAVGYNPFAEFADLLDHYQAEKRPQVESAPLTSESASDARATSHSVTPTLCSAAAAPSVSAARPDVRSPVARLFGRIFTVGTQPSGEQDAEDEIVINVTIGRRRPTPPAA